MVDNCLHVYITAVLAIVAVGIIIFAILVRRGVLSPPAQHISRIRETVRRRAQTIYGGLQEDRGHTRGRSNYAYDVRMTLNSPVILLYMYYKNIPDIKFLVPFSNFLLKTCILNCSNGEKILDAV